jgi:hypothetical protein
VNAAEMLVEEWVEDVFNREQQQRDAWASGAVERAWKAGYAEAVYIYEVSRHWDKYAEDDEHRIAADAWKRAKYEE